MGESAELALTLHPNPLGGNMRVSHLDHVGHTPLVRVAAPASPFIDVFAKLELCNPTGSVKDRAALYILDSLIKSRKISRSTTIIESSSGNFGVALAARTKSLGIPFTCVIDPLIANCNEMLLGRLGAEIVKVDTRDAQGGYLRTRLDKVHELLREIPSSYWVNQYGNPLNAEAYRETLGNEVCDAVPGVDYVFLGVSSGGTITGVSQKIKERAPGARVIAVDMDGSVVFGGKARKRYIPGIGSSVVPPILADALIDDVVYVNEADTIRGCHELLANDAIFAGGSSGSVMAAITKYFRKRRGPSRSTVVAVMPDRGERYIDTIYDAAWCSRFIDPSLFFRTASLGARAVSQ